MSSFRAKGTRLGLWTTGGTVRSQSDMVLSRELSNSVEALRIFLDQAFFVDDGCVNIVGVNINLDQVQCLQQWPTKYGRTVYVRNIEYVIGGLPLRFASYGRSA